MALTRDFREAVAQKKLLRVRIMLKDSLLVDTSFKQFNEMAQFAESSMKNLWISDEDDKEEFSQSADALNNILAGLVNKFSKRRILHLKKMINKLYPQKTKQVTYDNTYRRKEEIIPPTQAVRLLKSIMQEEKKINEVCEKINSKNKMDKQDIVKIKLAAKNIIEYCDKIRRK